MLFAYIATSRAVYRDGSLGLRRGVRLEREYLHELLQSIAEDAEK